MTALTQAYAAGLVDLGQLAAVQAVSELLQTHNSQDVDSTWRDVSDSLEATSNRNRERAALMASRYLRAVDMAAGRRPDQALYDDVIDAVLSDKGHPLGADKGQYLLKVRPKQLTQSGTYPGLAVRESAARVGAEMATDAVSVPNEVVQKVMSSRGESWARKARPNCCAFCAMLVSRGSDYRTQKTAAINVHPGCMCIAVPVSQFDVNDPVYQKAKQIYKESPPTFIKKDRKNNKGPKNKTVLDMSEFRKAWGSGR